MSENENHIYIAIDLKSFYASVECQERDLDPLTTNLYLCKVAMDIVAKHVMPDAHGVRIAELDEMSYRKLLWNHRPLTDFWRVGSGYRKKLEAAGLYTMGDIARCSIGGERDYYNEELFIKCLALMQSF